jgi:hypothetical protein
MILTDSTYDPIARMNAARDVHRARGTSGGKGNRRAVTATERREREVGMTCHELALATVDAIWSEFRSWSQSGRIDPLMGRYEPESDFPF